MSLSPSLLDVPSDGSGVRAAAVALFNASGVQLNGFDPSSGTTATLSQITPQLTSQIALAANPLRRKARFFNPTNKTILITEGPTTTATAYTDQIPSLTSWSTDTKEYNGDISVMWQSAPSAGPKLQVTEVT